MTKVIATAINWCANVDDPSGLSDDTVKKVLEKSGFEVTVRDKSPTPMTTTRFS